MRMGVDISFEEMDLLQSDDGRMQFIITFKEAKTTGKPLKGKKTVSPEKSAERKKTQETFEKSLSKKAPGAKKTASFTKAINAIAVEVKTSELRDFGKAVSENKDTIEKIYADKEIRALMTHTIPLVGADAAWKELVEGAENMGDGVKVGVIDTGVDYTHEDFGSCTEEEFLNGECAKVAGGYDFANMDKNPVDDQGHGTHVAGIIAGESREFSGMAPHAKIFAYKVMASDGTGSTSNVISGIEASIDPNGDGDPSDHLDIINLSLGGWGDPDDPLSTAIDNATAEGILAVVAAGNDNYEFTVNSPGTARTAITVAASYKKDYVGQYWSDTDPTVDKVTSFSSKGPVTWSKGIIAKPDITAPGALICATRYDSIFEQGEHEYYGPCMEGKHVELGGTSMAAPVVAGAAALVKNAHPEWTPEEIKSALMLYSKPLPLGYEANWAGSGRLDVGSAVNAGLTISPVPFDFGNIPEEGAKSIEVEVKNHSGERKGFFVAEDGFRGVYSKDEAGLEKSEKTVYRGVVGMEELVCVEPGETKKAVILADASSVPKDMFYGQVKAQVLADCNPAIVEKESLVPASFAKMNELKIRFAFDDKIGAEHGQRFVFIMLSGENKEFSSYKIVCTDGDCDSELDVLVAFDRGELVFADMMTEYTPNLEYNNFDPKFFSKWAMVVSKKNIEPGKDGTVLVDESKARRIESNLNESLAEKGLHPLVVSAGVMSDIWTNRKGTVYSISGFFDETCAVRSQDFGVFADLPEGEEDLSVYLHITGKQEGKSFHDSQEFAAISGFLDPKTGTINAGELAKSTLDISASLKEAEPPSFGIDSYLPFIRTTWGAFNFSVYTMAPVREGEHALYYNQNPAIGHLLGAINYARKKDYADQTSYNGYWKWNDFTLGKPFPEHIYLLKEPIRPKVETSESGFVLQGKFYSDYSKSPIRIRVDGIGRVEIKPVERPLLNTKVFESAGYWEIGTKDMTTSDIGLVEVNWDYSGIFKESEGAKKGFGYNKDGYWSAFEDGTVNMTAKIGENPNRVFSSGNSACEAFGKECILVEESCHNLDSMNEMENWVEKQGFSCAQELNSNFSCAYRARCA